MRCSARAALAAFLAAALARPVAAAPAATDAFRVAAPGAPCVRAADLDPPGRLSWTLAVPRASEAQVRVEVVGVRTAVASDALDEVLGRERADVLARAGQVPGVERGAFEPDAPAGGKLTWRGFHVHVRAADREGEVWRWAALAPDFPRRRLAYLVALDEQTPAGARPVPHVAEGRALVASLAPVDRNPAGSLPDAWLDARVATFSARIDSTTRLCWRAEDDAPGHRFTGVARGLAGGGDFFQSTVSLPADSVVDAASTEYGAGFDRNGDGRVDLVVLNRGVVSAKGRSMLPAVLALADDDFDGKVDGCVLETGDADGDGRVDHRLCVLDANHDGTPDRAVRFVDNLSDPSNRKLSIKNGVVEDTLVGSPVARIDLAQAWRDGDALLARWNRVRAACTP